ncbi:MAG: ribonuclease III [Chloroflexi bacterium]|nr:ribonuclease III [Chloroflexota bacterium]
MLDSFQAKAGLRFADPSFLRRALVHRSYLNEHPEENQDNERLEFLGDAVLDFVTGAFLYNRFPEMSEGALTRLRAALVRTEQLAEFAARLGVGEVMRLGRGESDAGGRARDRLLCATFEAIVGALYLDSGLQPVREFVEPLLGEAADRILETQADVDAKSLLQEWAQAELGQTPHYHTVTASGPDHAKQFTVEARIGSEVYGVGTGRNKQIAAQSAAEEALKRVGLL